MANGEWIMVNGGFLTRITRIMRMARSGEREGKGIIINREAGLFNCRLGGKSVSFMVVGGNMRKIKTRRFFKYIPNEYLLVG